MRLSAQELQTVKDELDKNDLNVGLGVLHEPTDQIYLAPFDSLPGLGGHAEFVAYLGLSPADCKGFVILRPAPGSFTVVNSSHLNGVQGQPASLQMPPSTFQAILLALRQAGL